MRILVVGGVAAGASAATRARRCNEDAEIIIFEKGNYVSFANCGLPYYIGGVIEERDDLLLVTPELFRERFAIDVRLNHEVLSIDRAKKTILVKSQSGTVEEAYDKLILAAGGRPIAPPIPGTQLAGVHTVFTVPDADAIVSALEVGMERVVIVGGGFIGLETAEAMLKKGVQTTLVERLPYLMNTMDPEFSEAAARHLREIGVDVRLGSGLSEVCGETHAEAVVLENGEKLPCDMVVLAMGVSPSTALAKEAGLEIGVSGGVKVDATMRSSDPAIYCAGDMVESLHLVSGKPVRIPLAGSANKQGRVAGANAAGSSMLFKGVLGTSIVKVGALTLAKTGLSESEAEKLGMQYKCVFVPGFSNATYYPDAEPLVLKLTVEVPTGKLLGAQGIGRKGVDKRIDVLATALYAGLTVFDLENLDLAYAPPYASAKDPVILGGMIFANILRGSVDSILPAEVAPYLAAHDGAVVLDVRTQAEYDADHIDGALLLPVDELRTRYAELDPGKTYIVYCGVGYRAYNACLFLTSKGYRTINMSGGIRAYCMNV